MRLETRIKAPVERCFDLSLSIDLHQESVKHTKEKAIAGRKKGLIELNEFVTWRARHFFIWLTMTVKITRLNRPHHFQDKMIKGPFKLFEHDHFFRQEGDETIMVDDFRFSSPLGFLGKIVDKLYLERYMRKLLQRRNQMIKEYAEANKVEWIEIN